MKQDLASTIFLFLYMLNEKYYLHSNRKKIKSFHNVFQFLEILPSYILQFTVKNKKLYLKI